MRHSSYIIFTSDLGTDCSRVSNSKARSTGGVLSQVQYSSTRSSFFIRLWVSSVSPRAHLVAFLGRDCGVSTEEPVAANDTPQVSPDLTGLGPPTYRRVDVRDIHPETIQPVLPFVRAGSVTCVQGALTYISLMAFSTGACVRVCVC